MKKSLIVALLILSVIKSKAQEFSVQVNSGISHFTGDATTSSTFLAGANSTDHSGYPNNVGSRFLPTYGVGIQLQKVNNNLFIYGARFGFEALNSRVGISSVGDGENAVAATGYADNYLYYFNFNPFIGLRANLNKVKLDITTGLEVAPGLIMHKSLNVKASDGNYYNKPEEFAPASPREDFRWRFGLEATYNKFGVSVNYSHGLKNFNAGTLADNELPSYYSELIRLGISYRIK